MDLWSPWVLATLVLSSTNLSLILLYWAVTLHASYSQAARLSSSPHLLLTGLLLASSSNLLHLAVDPEDSSFSVVAEISALAYALIYSSLFVRLVFLRCLSQGIVLPSAYQAIILFFALLVQAGLSFQRLALLGISDSGPHSDLFSLLYTSILLLLLLALAASTRGLRSDPATTREVCYIWLLSLTSLALWLGWVSIALILDRHYYSIKAIGLELFVLTTILFFCLTKRHKLRLSRKPRLTIKRHSTFRAYSRPANEDISYLGFHRPTRVIPHIGGQHYRGSPVMEHQYRGSPVIESAETYNQEQYSEYGSLPYRTRGSHPPPFLLPRTRVTRIADQLSFRSPNNSSYLRF